MTTLEFMLLGLWLGFIVTICAVLAAVVLPELARQRQRQDLQKRIYRYLDAD